MFVLCCVGFVNGKIILGQSNNQMPREAEKEDVCVCGYVYSFEFSAVDSMCIVLVYKFVDLSTHFYGENEWLCVHQPNDWSCQQHKM